MIKKKIKEIDKLFNGYFIPTIGALGMLICMISYVIALREAFSFSLWAGCLFLIISCIISGIVVWIIFKIKKIKIEKESLEKSFEKKFRGSWGDSDLIM
ncbi:hypothetical protein M1N80_04325 [Peptococcaceae bacterium]|nr:hypothetical protein [Peptococcaceae bacterium]MCL0101005.1 hypothetical protein [Peptococcaceae bacterium]